MNINHERFVRVLLRCIELGKQTDINPAIAAVYEEALAAPAGDYLAADTLVTKSLITLDKENKEALLSLVFLDGPYKVARSTLKALHPETTRALPDTLKSLPTDTDKLKAIKWLVSTIKDHTGKAWADGLLAGEFGTKAAATIKEIEEAVEANKLYTKAKIVRAAAYEPAYTKYLDFKQVVRDALGPNSKEYRRIHLRASPSTDADKQEDAPAAQPGGKPGQQTTPSSTPAGAQGQQTTPSSTPAGAQGQQATPASTPAGTQGQQSTPANTPAGAQQPQATPVSTPAGAQEPQAAPASTPKSAPLQPTAP